MQDQVIKATGSSTAPGTVQSAASSTASLPLPACIVAARPRRSLWLSDNEE